MTRKRVDLNTCVWGGWHLDVMRHVMLPTLLSPGNLPALVSRFPLRYRIATTPQDRKHIEAWPIFSRLAAAVEIEWITESSSPDITYHIEWYRRSLSDAKSANAICLMAYPDVAWNDGLFARCADAIAEGRVGVAIPYIRVISETFVPEMATRAGDSPIELSGAELVRLGMRHMHPLSVVAMADSRHALPSLEVSWRVPDQGLLLREMSRELTMIDTERLQANQYWNTIKTARPESLHIAADSDDMLMLSVAPLLKDFQVYIPNHTLQPLDLARVSLHPDNNNPLIEHFAARQIRLHYKDFDENRWGEFERRADRFVGEALFARQFLGIWEVVRAAGCSLAAQAMSVGLIATSLARRWRCGSPVTAYIPSDEAFGDMGSAALALLLRPEQASKLEGIILNHMVPGTPVATASDSWRDVALGGLPLHGRTHGDSEFVNEAKVIRHLDFPHHRICVIDRLLVPIEAATDSSSSSLRYDLRLKSDNSDPGGNDTATAVNRPKPGLRGLLLRKNFHRLKRGVRRRVVAAAEKVRDRAPLRMPQWSYRFRDSEAVARSYPAFLRHFGVELTGGEFEQQKRAAATALYQAGLYRHRLLFLHDLITRFSALGGATDPRPAFLDYCSALVGSKEDLMRAERYYRLALRLVPNFAEALYALGLLMQRAGATGEATVLLEAAAYAPPHPNAVPYAYIAANAWRSLGKIHGDFGNYATAEACFRNALLSHGNHGVYQTEFAKFLRERSHIVEAAQQYELSMPYSHMYPCEFSEPNYPPEQRLPVDFDGRPCDPLRPTVVANETQGQQLLYWWHLYLRIPAQAPFDAASLLKLKLQGRPAIFGL